MNNTVATDEENVIRLKLWWQKNRTWLLTVIILALAGFGVFKYYTGQQQKTTEAASLLFTEFFGAHAEGNQDLINQLSTQLQQDYAQTPYANTVALILARDAVGKNDLAAANQQLTWILEKGAPFAKEIATARLAQVKIAQQDPEGALKLVSDAKGGEYQPLFDEIKGDALFALKRYKDAREAYNAAIDGYSQLGLETHLLQFKLDALPA